jgi:DNA-binding winged helix-turn-helix (wHTH) protein
VFSREQLLDGVWGSEIYIDERTVDVHVGRLRKALNRGHETDPIRTVRGAGYALDDRFGKVGVSPAVIVFPGRREACEPGIDNQRPVIIDSGSPLPGPPPE